MSNSFPEKLHLDGAVYDMFAYPLCSYLAQFPDWPRFPNWPGNSRGYSATWAVIDDVLCLTGMRAPVEEPLAALFPGIAGPVPATWVSGIIDVHRGERRHVGYPSRRIFDDEVYLEISCGRVLREWRFDLRGVPDQTDEELKLSLPRFLWPARLRDDPDPVEPK